jgi:hypothetical protein
MNPNLVMPLLAALLFTGMVVLTRLGHRAGRRRLSRFGEGEAGATGAVDAAVFALFGLLMAFTFSGAYGRYEARRQLIVQEANAIGTAWLRLDLLPPETQPALRKDFRTYVDSRLDTWRLLSDLEAARAKVARSTDLQAQIWSQAVAASESSQPARMLLLPALNDMIDVTTTRYVAWQTHAPLIVFVMLFGLALACAWLAGYGMAKSASPSRWHSVAFAVITVATVYVIMDIEYPRFGLVQLDAANELLAYVRASMR